ncbi:DUF2207 domain-containing protein [Pelagibacterium montanilacus]|uniref:DUF2207 domain-containing protein n=1 Tax=Pelagibacterium montanilacus TaxID=2185280 RepID=UPI000F8DD439|nr:DUF2207 domain-containing protein [Pelagibacterium montanilacus]
MSTLSGRLVLRLLALMMALVLGPLGGQAWAQEVIRSFETAIVVQPDTSVQIIETITVNAEGQSIQRGIFRDIPTVLETDDGGQIRSTIRVQSVTRNGSAEPYSLENIHNGRRIRIGDPDIRIGRGVHRYQIRYTMDRAARMFGDRDEIYWNATGNFWEFSINQATAVVTLPEGATISDLAVFTGPQGAVESEASIERLSDRQARFVTTSRLAPYEGMTVAVAFEPGILSAPEGFDAFGYWLSDNRDFWVPALLLAIVFVYNGWAWSTVGRDPARGVIFPRFHAPKGFSPALTHYVHRMGWASSGWSAFSAALVSLATKGLIEIEARGKTTTLMATPMAPPDDLPPGEEVILRYLRGKDMVTIDKEHGPELAEQRVAFTRAIEGENRKVYFNNHYIYTVAGAVIGGLGLLVMGLADVLDPELIFLSLFITMGASGVAASLRGLWQGDTLGKLRPVLFVVYGLFMFGGLMTDFLTALQSSFAVIAAGLIVATTIVFGVLMRAPTLHGRQVMDEIEGFKMYLETAEKERLNFQDEPEMSVARFETILPYAMALGVEKPWAERFENDLVRHAVRDAPRSYSPAWYHGSRFSGGRLAATMGGLAAGLSSAMVAAQPAKSSGSGFSGGSSGGGGGGGGGGGW